MKKKSTWIVTGIVAVLIAGGAFAGTRSTASTTGSSALANATTAPVTRTTLLTSVDSNGSIIPQSTVNLSFGSAGTVEQVNVETGDQVKQGHVLATLDATSLQLAVTHAEQAYVRQQLAYSETVEADPTDVAVAEAAYNSAVASYNAARQDYSNLSIKESLQCSSLSSAKANLDRAQAEYDRLANDHQAKNYLNSDWGPYQNIVNGLTNAQSAYDLALANCNITKTSLNDSSLRSAQAQVQNAKANLDTLVSPRAEEQILAKTALQKTRIALEQAKRNLTNAQIVAPFDGVITAVDITIGDTGGASTAMTIADNSQLHVDVLVDETEIANVQAGQTAQVTLDALSDITLTGKVAYIAPSGSVSNGVVNYSVRVNLDPTEAPLLLDMTADASLIGEKHENVLAVPTKAIHTASAGQTSSVSRTGQVSNTVQSGQSGPQHMTGSFVLVVQNGQPHPVQVTVGMTAGDLTEVSGDLKEGDQVLVATTTSTTSNTNQPGDFGPPDGSLGGPPPGAGGPPPGG